MSVIKIREKGNFKKSEALLTKAVKLDVSMERLKEYGEAGVKALQEATPKRTGETARHWSYRIEKNRNSVSIKWFNDYAPRFVQVALLLQYGHATKNGSWVEGFDYINPALAPVFAELEDKVWKEATRT